MNWDELFKKFKKDVEVRVAGVPGIFDSVKSAIAYKAGLWEQHCADQMESGESMPFHIIDESELPTE